MSINREGLASLSGRQASKQAGRRVSLNEFATFERALCVCLFVSVCAFESISLCVCVCEC